MIALLARAIPLPRDDHGLAMWPDLAKIGGWLAHRMVHIEFETIHIPMCRAQTRLARPVRPKQEQCPLLTVNGFLGHDTASHSPTTLGHRHGAVTSFASASPRGAKPNVAIAGLLCLKSLPSDERRTLCEGRAGCGPSTQRSITSHRSQLMDAGRESPGTQPFKASEKRPWDRPVDVPPCSTPGIESISDKLAYHRSPAETPLGRQGSAQKMRPCQR